MERQCEIEGCAKRAKARGWCAAHWKMWRIYGDPRRPPNYKRSPESIAKRNAAIRRAHARPETKARLSAISRARHADPDYQKRQRAAAAIGVARHWATVTKAQKAKRLEKWIAAGHAASADITRSGIEFAVEAELERRGIRYVPQKFIGPYRVDFYLIGRRVIVECDGLYWHSRPGIPEFDAKRDRFHTSRGFVVVRLTETEINNDVVSAVDRALAVISGKAVRVPT